mgnify:CR=1 FL=1
MSQSPIELFLGTSACEHGPFGLLELGIDLHDENDVLAALRDRIRRVDEHPQSSTPAADEVRLALHAAAAQLLDPGIQRRLVERWRLAGSREAPPEPMDPMLAMSLMGGWTPQSLRRLAMLAQAQNMPVERMIQAISQRAGYGAGLGAAVGAGFTISEASHRSPADTEGQPAHAADSQLLNVPRSSGPSLAMILIAAIVLLGMLGGALLVLRPEPAVVTTPTPAGPTQSAPPPDLSEAAVVEPERVESTPVDLAAASDDVLLDRLDAAIGAVGFDAMAAVKDAEPAIAALAARWASLAPGALLRANGLVLELVYETAAWPEANRELAAIIARPARQAAAGALEEAGVAPSVWSAGMLGRLGIEPDLPSRTSFAIAVALREATGATGQSVEGFDGGTLLMTGRLPAALLDAPPQAWDEWAAIARRVTAGDSDAEQRLLLSGLEMLMRVETSSAVDAVDRLVGSVEWSEASLARPWLVRTMLAPQATSSGLHAVTSGLARRALAGFDLGMVLSRSASEYERRNLAEELAQLWGLESLIGSGEVAGAWSDQLGSRERDFEIASAPIEHLALAVRFARLSEAATLRWRGDNPQATEMLASDDADVEAIIERRRSGNDRSFEADDAWGLEFLRAERDPRLRMRLLASVASRQTIGAMSAEVLVQEAIRGSTRPSRDAARAAVVSLAGNASIVNALLEELPRIRPSRVGAELIEAAIGTRLPPPSDPDWMLLARRGLVERMLELVASQTDRRAFDELSVLLAETYRDRLATPVASGRSVSPEVAAIMLRSEFEQIARTTFAPADLGFGLADIETARVTRLSVASGPPQRFLAQQLSVVSLLGVIVASEQPARAAEVASELRRLDAERQQAETVLEQIAVGERAMARLWAIRLEERLSS